VPAYFSKAQKQATHDACSIAGLECLRLISEPTAASIAYRLTNETPDEFDEGKMVVVFDFGGGTLDVSVINVTGFSMDVCATSGDAFLGGRDFDEAIVDYCLE